MAPDHASSIRKYQDENGVYQLPNDATEHERLDFQSIGLAQLLRGRPCRAPLHNPKRILDVGCGTGIMTTHMANLYPEAQVVGVDISPVPEIHGRPTNVMYLQGNVMDREWRSKQPELANEGFDYVFSRLLIFGISDWPAYAKAISSLVRAGGWLEMHEPEATVFYDSHGKRVEHADMQYFVNFVADTKKAAGLDLAIAPNLSGMLKRDVGGWARVEEEYFKWPSSPPLKEDEEAAGLFFEYNRTYSFPMGRVMLEKICRPHRSDEEMKVMLDQCDRRMLNDVPGEYVKLFVVTGQKCE